MKAICCCNYNLLLGVGCWLSYLSLELPFLCTHGEFEMLVQFVLICKCC